MINFASSICSKIFGTSLLVGIVFALSDKRNNQIVQGLQPFMVGLLVFAIGEKCSISLSMTSLFYCDCSIFISKTIDKWRSLFR